MIPTRLLVSLACLALLLTACKKEDDDPTGPDDNGPGTIARIEGVVRDAAGNPLPSVALHFYYELPAPVAVAQPELPATVLLSTEQVLYTECGGTTPIPDGVMVHLFWDQNNNNVADDSDPQPPLCSQPPECPEGPTYTVNLNEFPMNGEAMGMGAGTFYMERALYITEALTPNRFYARIYCGDGNVLYTSNLVNIPQGFSEQAMTFTCTPCSGAPEVPAWRLEQSYPNPATDSITVRYALQQAAPVLLTLHWPERGIVDTLFYAAQQPSGGHRLRVGLDGLPHDVANGLYRIRLSAGTFNAEQYLLRNVENYNLLRGMEAAASSGADGSYGFNTAAGVSIERRTAAGDPESPAVLSRLRVVALHPEYQDADTSFDIAGGGTYTVNFRLVAR